MISVDDAVKELFKKNYRQVARLTIKRKDSQGHDLPDTILTEHDICQGGLTVDRYSITGSGLEVGTAIAAQLNLKLYLPNKSYIRGYLEDAEIFVEVGVKKWDADQWENAEVHYVPLGYFVSNQLVRIVNDVLTLTLQDRMVKLDQMVDLNKIKNPVTPSSSSLTLKQMVNCICNECGVPVENVTRFDNVNKYIPRSKIPGNVTYRTLIRHFAFITGTCAYFDVDGTLKFGWYREGSISLYETLDVSDRYYSQICTDRSFITGGIQYYFDDGNALFRIYWGEFECPGLYIDDPDVPWIPWEFGDKGKLITGKSITYGTTKIETRNNVGEFGDHYYYLMEYSNSPLVKVDSESASSSWIYPRTSWVNDIECYAMEARIKPMPWLLPMDCVKYVDKTGDEYVTYLTHVSFTLNCGMKVACGIDEVVLSKLSTMVDLRRIM